MKKIIIKPNKNVIAIFIFSISFFLILLILSIFLSFIDINGFYAFLMLSIASLILVINGFSILQWWIITDNEIIVRNIFGIINSINRDLINDVEIIKLKITRDDVCDCFVINGNKSVKNYDSFYNKRNKPIRIPVNDITLVELEKYVL